VNTSTLTDADKTRFQDTLAAVYDYYGKTLTEAAAKLWWRTMRARVSIEQFEGLMAKQLETSEFLPRIANIVEALNPHPAPEEAWNRVPKSEYEGGWVTDEIMAGLAACHDSIDRGDMVGARMAFIESYKSAIAGKTDRPRWWLTRPIGQREPDRIAWEEQMFLTAPDPVSLEALPDARHRIENQKNGTKPLLTGGKGIAGLLEAQNG